MFLHALLWHMLCSPSWMCMSFLTSCSPSTCCFLDLPPAPLALLDMDADPCIPSSFLQSPGWFPSPLSFPISDFHVPVLMLCCWWFSFDFFYASFGLSELGKQYQIPLSLCLLKVQWNKESFCTAQTWVVTLTFPCPADSDLAKYWSFVYLPCINDLPIHSLLCHTLKKGHWRWKIIDWNVPDHVF